MRMTRAQAAALAAAEADDDQDLDTRSTTPTQDASMSRGPLSELDTSLVNDAEPSNSTTSSTLEHEGPSTTSPTLEHEGPSTTSPTLENQGSKPDSIGQEREQETQQAEASVEREETDDVKPNPHTSTTEKPNHISIHQDESLKLPERDVDAGSPTTELPLLNITPQRTPAKNVLKNEFAHMRSTSNKENMVPGSPVVPGPVDRLQTHVELLGGEQEVQQDGHAPQTSNQYNGQEQPHGNHENDRSTAPKTEKQPEIAQAGKGQDDTLIENLEKLQISPKKTPNFSEQPAKFGAERPVQSAAEPTPQPQNGPSEPEQQPADTAKDDPTGAQKQTKASTLATAQKPSPRTSQSDARKPTRKPSVRESTIKRQSSVVRKSLAPRPEATNTSAIRRTTSVKRSSVRPSMAPRAGSSQSNETTSAGIPHSKPRPMSMSFPTPPPPPKSSKAPTQSTFQLPGEAVAAKLRAEKEERLKRQAEQGDSKPVYKPPPPPKSTKAPTRSTFQLSGEAVAAKLKAEKEERQRRQEESGGAPQKSTFVPPAAPKSTKPLTKATFQLSSDIFAAKMKAQKEERLKKQQEEEEKKEKEKHVFKARPAPKVKEPALVRQTAASLARLPGKDSNGLRRATSVRDSSTTAQKRLSTFQPSSSTSGSAPPPRASTSFNKRQSTVPFVSKGKEVFSRAAASKAAEEKEKKEKEEAAKKARREAAEKGRQASREWAEKKKKEKAAVSATAAA